MTTEMEIGAFLRDFHAKMGIWGIVVRDDRGKNIQTLLDLEISRIQRDEVLRQLTVEDYSKGPEKDKLHMKADKWVFGKLVKGKEIYIKVTMGAFQAQVICISFHFAEFPMQYPFPFNLKKGADLKTQIWSLPD